MTPRAKEIIKVLVIAGLGLLTAIYLKQGGDIPGFGLSVEYRQLEEVGDEVVVKFPDWMPEFLAQRAFSISPEIAGQTYWDKEARELHFVPELGFEPGVTYHVFGMPHLLSAVISPGSGVPIQGKAALAGHTVLSRIPPATGKYIDANLATMRLTLYENGQIVKSYPIGGKGNPKTGPTRQGTFKILTKEERHWSRRGSLWMPLSMQFSGNYFIHGWPYWPNGRKLTSVYSSGCIRLFDPDALEVFRWAEVGTPLTTHSTLAVGMVLEAYDGELVREGADPRVWLIKHTGNKRFRREVKAADFAKWYPHLEPLWDKVKFVPAGTLQHYAISRWIRSTEPTGAIYELDSTWTKHLITCQTHDCLSAWSSYGWDSDEVYVALPDELKAYPDGAELPLLPATGIQVK